MFKYNNKVNINGFTLAELLILMFIIGVISSLTIPGLIKNIEDVQNKAQAKASFSILSQVMLKMKENENFPDFTLAADPDGNNDFRSKFCEYVNCVKTGTMDEIFANFYKFYRNDTLGTDYTGRTLPSAALNNGMIFLFESYGNNCAGVAGFYTTVCGYTYVDTNGRKVPNMYGKDYLTFWIIRQNGEYVLVPAGNNTDLWECVVGSDRFNTSGGCTSYYFTNRDLP